MSGFSSSRLFHLSRRQSLQVGVLSGLGITLPGILRHEARAATPAPRAKSVIALFLGGGFPHHDSFDPKPEAVAEVRGELQTIATKVPNYRVSELLPRTAAIADRLTIIRSVRHAEPVHQRGLMYMLEGRQPPLATGEFRSGNPLIGSLVAHQLGMRNGLPAFVSMPGFHFAKEFTGPGWLPAASGPFFGTQARALAPNEQIKSEQFADRLALRSAFDPPLAPDARTSDQERGWDRFSAQAVDILRSGKAAAAFRYQDEPLAIQRLYGIDPARMGPTGGDNLGGQLLTARRLVESGARFVTVEQDGWDDHEKIFPNIRWRLPTVDDAFSGLIRDLDQRGLLEETLVLCLTEFGRTPKVNDKGGRDHWPTAFSIALAGAGVPGGQVLGATDKTGAAVKERPVSPEEIAATILTLVGIDPRQQYVRADGRPMMFVDEAQPIGELMS
jgi:uncharacterized protein (DUF1501 family)